MPAASKYNIHSKIDRQTLGFDIQQIDRVNVQIWRKSIEFHSAFGAISNYNFY